MRNIILPYIEDLYFLLDKVPVLEYDQVVYFLMKKYNISQAEAAVSVKNMVKADKALLTSEKFISDERHLNSVLPGYIPDTNRPKIHLPLTEKHKAHLTILWVLLMRLEPEDRFFLLNGNDPAQAVFNKDGVTTEIIRFTPGQELSEALSLRQHFCYNRAMRAGTQRWRVFDDLCPLQTITAMPYVGFTEFFIVGRDKGKLTIRHLKSKSRKATTAWKDIEKEEVI